MDSTAPRDELAPATPVQRRPYERPVLTKFGDLTQLTRQKGMTGPNTDGSPFNNNKTQ